MTGTALAQRKAIVGTLEENAKSLVPYLPEGVNPMRVIGLVKMAVDDNPDLLNCSPSSVLQSVAKICSWGAEIGTDAFLVPFGNKCTPVRGYKWLCDLVVQAGGARALSAKVVYANDIFEYEDGAALKLRWVPASFSGKQPGAIRGAFAKADIGGGIVLVEWMSIEELEAHRQQFSKQWKKGPMPPWWAKKTVLLRLIKTLPKSPQVAAMFARMNIEKAIAETEGDLNPADEVVAAAPESDMVTRDGEVRDETPDFEVEEEPDLLTLEQARALRVPGKANDPKVFGGKGGKRLDETLTSFLESLKAWCAKQVDKEDGLQNAAELVAACGLVIAAYKSGELAEPEKRTPVPAPAAPAPAPKREPIGASVGLPGNDDELPF